jgi:predicted  nucleic acid-binding Zn-ribbon protein
MTEEREQAVDGLTVRKSIDSEGFPVPAVTFEINSEREDAVVVRIVDHIPESFPMEKVGFHPEYESGSWTAYPDQRVEFEHRLDPGESVTTVYGVRLKDPEETDQFMSDPDVEALSPASADASEHEEGLGDSTMADIAPPERTGVVRDVIEGERDTVPGLEDGEDRPADILEELGDPIEEDPAADEDPTTEAAPDDPGADGVGTGDPLADVEGEATANGEPVEAEQGTGPAGDAADPVDDPAREGGPDDAPAGATPAASPGNVAVALAEEIESGQIDEETLATLGDAFGGVPNSVDTRISHVQSRVSDIEAYADAIEEFIDENGTARELLDQLEAETERLDARTERLEAELADDLDQRLEESREERAEIRADVEAVETLLEESVDDLEGDLAEVTDDLDALADRLEDAEADLAAEVETVEDDVEAVRDDLAEIEAWREQLSSVLGGAGAGGDPE